MHVPVIPTWTFQDRLRKARESAGLKQSQLAEILGVATGSIQRWEKGTHEPRMATLKALAGATNVPLEWLLHGEGETEREEAPVELKEVTITWSPEGLQVDQTEQK